MKISTIGYERSTLDKVIGTLTAHGIKRLIDVRAVASSRKAGFSKTLLSASLAEAGVEYVHLRALGTPKAGREAARKGRIDEMHEIFEGQLATPEAVDAMAQATAMVQEKPSALLCFEADAAGCHRRIVAERLSAATGMAVQDLAPSLI